MGVVITPEQFTPRPMPVGKNDFTGMVHCPQRWSHIAVLRCAEYQAERGCGLACKNAVTAEQVKAVIAQSKRDIEPEEPVLARGKRVCVVCGKRKKSETGSRCAACRAAAMRKITRCGRCGKPATRYLKTEEPLCGNCANRALNVAWERRNA